MFALAALFCFSLNTAEANDNQGLLQITSPKSSQSLFGEDSVTIFWKTDMGEGFKYSVSFSSDGISYSTPIAVGITDMQCTWKPNVKIGSSGWIKVKMMEYNGVPIAESTVKVSWIPEDVVIVSKANQRVYRFSAGKLKYNFICSTALPEFDGTEGEYAVYSRQIKHWSKKYELWMPYSLFYYKGYALHATTATRMLGRPASHGCVRLRSRDAKKLFEDVPIGTRVIVLPPDIDVGYLGSINTLQTNAKDTPAAKS